MSRRIMVKVGRRKWELTPKQNEIVGVLKEAGKQWLGPTAIGANCGRQHDAGAWCYPALQELVEMGVVERKAETARRGTYRLAKG